MNKRAFTLAEVLITLGIIGVVASMTLPSVIAKFKRQEAAARLKKFNSMMAQVLILSENDNGNVNSWDMSLVPEEFVKKYFAPYLKYLKIGSNLSGSATIYFTDGSFFSIVKGRCMDILFDVNGDNRPNKEGYDKFRFLACDKTITEWCSNKGWCTYRGDKTPTRENALRSCKSNPAYCSSLLEIDNWEFKDDYPYKL